jgi:hypothetical protein
LEVPRARFQVALERRHGAPLDLAVDEAPGRLGPAHGGVEELLRAGVVGLGEPVHAVDRHRQRRHAARPAQDRLDPADRGIAAPLGGDQLGHVPRQPEPVQRVAVERQDHDRPAADPPQLAQAPVGVGPLVDGDQGHGRVEAVVGEGQVLRHCVHGRGQVRGPLGAHRGRRLDRGDLPVGRLVGPGARADVDNRPRVAQRRVHVGGEPRVGPALHGVAGAARLVVKVACQPRLHERQPSRAVCYDIRGASASSVTWPAVATSAK